MSATCVRELHVSPVATVGELLESGTLVAFNVGPDGAAYLVLALSELDYREEQPGRASFAKIYPRKSQRYRVVALAGADRSLDLTTGEEKFNIHEIQPIGKEILLLCVRSAYRAQDDFDLNGRVYSQEGRFVRGMLLGDGVETIQATASGEIWASYFDEGIFGNYGWKDPVGASGLVAWNASGEEVYQFDAGQISDCYALNVASERDVWCYYYVDFPLIHLRERRLDGFWKTPICGSRAFAVGGGHALLAGDYEDRRILHLLRLDPDIASLIADIRVVDGDKPVDFERVVGRGEFLYLLASDRLYKIGIDEVCGIVEGKR